MHKKTMILVIAILMAFGAQSFGANQDFQGIMTKNNEMRESLAWLTEGLYQLGNSKNGKLALTKDQKKKILPIFKSLADKNLVRLKADQNNGQNGARNNGGDNNNQWRQNQGGQGGQNGQGGQRRNIDLNSPEMQKRIKQMQELTDFGNAQMDAIDGILNKQQVNFIDNMDFNAEKYGFMDYQRMFGNGNGGSGQIGQGGQGQGNGQMTGGQGFNQAAIQQLRKKMRAAQEELVKLNNAVMNMLSSK